MNNSEIMNILIKIEEEKEIRLNAKDRDYLGYILKKQGCYHLLDKLDIDCEKEKAINRKIIYKTYNGAKYVFAELAKSGIQYAILKGAILSKHAYGDIGYRKSRDIDFLCAAKDIKKVEEIMYSLGYKQGKIENERFCLLDRASIIFYKLNTHQIAPLVLQTGERDVPFIEFDINKSIIWSESQLDIPVEEILEHTVEEELFTNIKVKTLQPIYFFITMCLHHYKDMNSCYLLYRKKRISLRRFYDIFYYLKEKSNVCKPKELFAVAENYHITNYLYYCLYYCQEIFHSDILVPYLQIFKSEEADRLTKVYGLRTSKQHEWKIELSERIFEHCLDKVLEDELSDEEMRLISKNFYYL